MHSRVCDKHRDLVGKQVVLPDGRRDIIVDTNDAYVLMVMPGCQCRVRVELLQPDHGDPHDAGTVPFLRSRATYPLDASRC